MEYVKKYKWALTGFMIMVVLNVATLASIWVIKPPAPSNRVSPGNTPMMHQYMDRELNMSENQKEQFKSLRKVHMEEARNLADSLRRVRRAYFEELLKNESSRDTVLIDSLAESMAHNYVRIENTMFRHLSDLKEILNESQREAFQQMIRKSLFRGPGPEGPPMHQRRRYRNN